MYTHVHVYGHTHAMAHAHGFSLFTMSFLGGNSGRQVWWQVILPTELAQASLFMPVVNRAFFTLSEE